MAARFRFDIETASASCPVCHVSALDITSYQQAGEWHAAHQRRCTPPAVRPAATVLQFPAGNRAAPSGTSKETHSG